MVKDSIDIMVHGATGFTGKLICKYLYNHKDIKNINWAISGRNENKLKLISDRYNIDYYIADAFDKKSLDNITLISKTIISVVGPYTIFGKKLVESCVQNKCHYLDLTGEPAFVNYVEKFHSKSSIENNVILMNCCGFESIPPDLGIYYSLKKINDKNIAFNSYLSTKGQISGGTWASFINSFSSKKSVIKDKSGIKKDIKKVFYNKELKKWALIFPVIDKYIVKKSSKNISLYGDNFSYNEYILFNNFYKIFILIISLIFIGFISKFKFMRRLLLSYIPSGSGPSKEKREKNWFNIKFFGIGKEKKIITTVSGGDPGYGETAKFISEMALCIIINKDKLNAKKGVITPAMCAPDLMIERLKNVGIVFKHEIVK